MGRFVGHALAAFVLGITPGAAETIKVAAWNMNNLHHVLGEPLRDRAPVRTAEDIALLQKYRDHVGADIFALQEVNGPKAANLVFPAGEWDVFFSGRYVEDLVTGRVIHPDPDQRSDRIYTGFAVRRGVFDAVTKRDVEALSVLHQEDQRPSRWGTEILVEANGELLRLLSIHLKSGCHGGSLEPPGTEDCVTLAAQREPLEEWIDTAAEGEVPFIIAGDWNRRIGIHGQNDHIWGEVDDGDPEGLNLWRLPFNQASGCNAGFTEADRLPRLRRSGLAVRR
jgi:endonuclease/exonuclease/phosphatase family metal-dependent hydrolase